MHCSGCGKQIPFAGQVCPHCQRDKSADQQRHAISMIGIFVGGVIGYAVNEIMGAIVGGSIGGAAAMFLPLAGTEKSVPPEVRIQEKTELPSPSKPNSADRLAELSLLKDKGLISEEEFSDKKNKILAEL